MYIQFEHCGFQWSQKCVRMHIPARAERDADDSDESIPLAHNPASASESLAYVRDRGAAEVGCDIHAHAPANKYYTNWMLYPFVLRNIIQTLLGMGMAMNVTAQEGRA